MPKTIPPLWAQNHQTLELSLGLFFVNVGLSRNCCRTGIADCFLDSSTSGGRENAKDVAGGDMDSPQPTPKIPY